MPSLLEALEQKYGESSTESEGSDDEGIAVSIFVPCKSPRAVVPALLVLNDCDITTAGEKDVLVAKCAGVEELDLAKNKLNDWPEVLGILQQMPRLKFVNLSFNVLSTPLRDMQIEEGIKWASLKNLVLNSTYVSWDSVQELLNHTPCLEEFHLSMNNYNDVRLHDDSVKCLCETNKNTIDETNSNEKNGTTKCSCPAYKLKHKHSGVRILHFNGNLIDNWKEVTKLGYAFPNLETLVLADCPIKSLDIKNDEEGKCNRNYERSESDCESAVNEDSPHDSFRKLKVINMNATHLCTWDDIEKLAKFPALECVRIQTCPLWESNEYTEHERRQLLIARLPNVKTLNGGGKITPDEREDAERAFIRYYMDKPESDQPERYFELVQIHGKLDHIEEMRYPNKRIYSYNLRSGDEIFVDCKKKLSESNITESQEKEMYGLK
nr:tubulin-specific chaperone cofactor E-like protein [Leptinotarsa decemlineata]